MTVGYFCVLINQKRIIPNEINWSNFDSMKKVEMKKKRRPIMNATVRSFEIKLANTRSLSVSGAVGGIPQSRSEFSIASNPPML